MSIGFILDENHIVTTSVKAYLDELQGLYQHLEIAPDLSLLPMKDYLESVKLCDSHHFHVPYFVKSSNYLFSYDDHMKYYTKLFSIIEDLRQHSIKTPSIVVHPELDYDRDQNITYNKKGIDALLNFIEQKKLDFNISVESLVPTTYGSRQDLVELVQFFSTKRLGICYDVVHDFRHQSNYQLPDDSFIGLVNHSHLHGINEMIHNSFSNCPIEIVKHIPDVSITLELLKNECGQNYLQILKKDLENLNTIKAPNQV